MSSFFVPPHDTSGRSSRTFRTALAVKYLSVALVMAACGLLPEDGHAQTVHGYTNGNACMHYSAPDVTRFDHLANSLYRRVDGGGDRWAACPIVFDWDQLSTGFYVNLYFTKSGGTLTCTVSAYDLGHTYRGSRTASVLTSGNGSIALGLEIPANTKYFGLYCVMPEGSFIDTYEYYSSVFQ